MWRLGTSVSSLVSEDGATLSQAITFCDLLIDNLAGDHELAKDIAETINRGQLVDAGVIDLDIDLIAYRQPPGIVPTVSSLGQNAPNPFNPSTKLSFDIAVAGHARLKVYDTMGRLVRNLVDEHYSEGRYEVIWNGRDNMGRMSAAGIYLYRLEVGNFTETKRMVLIK